MVPLNIEISVNTEIRRMRKNGWIVVNHFFDVLKVIYRQATGGNSRYEIDYVDQEEKVRLLRKLFKEPTIKCHIHKYRLDPRRRYCMRVSFSSHDLVVVSVISKDISDRLFLRVESVYFEEKDKRF